MHSRSLFAIFALPLLVSAAPFSIDVGEQIALITLFCNGRLPIPFTVTLPIPTELGFPGPSTTVTLSDAVAFVNEKSADIASMGMSRFACGLDRALD